MWTLFAVTVITLLSRGPTIDLPKPTVDLGWVRAAQYDDGWHVLYASYFAAEGEGLRTGDVVLSIDHLSMTDANALTAAHLLQVLAHHNARAATVIRDRAKIDLNLAHKFGRWNCRGEWCRPSGKQL